LRNPGLYNLFQTPREPGLVDLLTGSVKNYVHRIPGTSLDLVNAGTIPPNPAELLGSERMKKFLDFVRERYDHVVIDAPPVLPVTDSQILAQLVDDVMIVVEPCRVPRKAARRMVETLRAVEANIIGVAMNDKSGKGFKYYGNYGYYGHRYYGSYYGEGEAVADGLAAKVKKMLD
jgi:tyrosine-protein kinase Etk/Wzc